MAQTTDSGSAQESEVGSKVASGEAASSKPATSPDAETTPTRRRPRAESRCRFCRERAQRIDYKDILTLQGVVRGQGRIISGKRSGTCARHQRMVKRAIKQARFIGLMSYVESPMKAARGGRPW